MSSAESVKSRLKNYAKKNGRIYQDILILYVLERVLGRLSKSQYVHHFTLKGGILLYGMFADDFARATTDIDLLGGRIGNDKETMKFVFSQVLALDTDDPIRFDLEELEAVNIAENNKYPGVRIATVAYLDRTRIPVNIDIGFGDSMYPERVLMDYPTMLEQDPPQLFAYSAYTIVSEKLEAIVSLGLINSRYKDFYDLLSLSERKDFDGETLRRAIVETFANRGSTLEKIAAFEEGFTESAERQKRWNGFVRRKKVERAHSFAETVAETKAFLLPVIESIQSDLPYNSRWDHLAKKWIRQG